MKTAATATNAPVKPKSDAGSARRPFFKSTAPEERLQVRLRIGQPGDRFEREADRVADRVVDGTRKDAPKAAGRTSLTQRQPSEQHADVGIDEPQGEPDALSVSVTSEPSPVKADTVDTPDTSDTATAPELEPEQAVEAEHHDDLAALDNEVAPPLAESAGDASPEANLTLPPPLDTGPAEQVAVVQQVDLSGSSEEATTRFVDATPSAMAASQPAFAPALDASLQTEQRDLAASAPVLVAQTSGVVDVPAESPADIPVPADVSHEANVNASASADLAPVTAATPEPCRANAVRDAELEQEQSGSFWDVFKRWMGSFTSGIRTRDDAIDTSAGARPVVRLDEDADASRMEQQRQADVNAVRTQRDAQVDAFRNHPGQARVQPRKIDEARPVAISQEPQAPMEALADSSVADYAAAPLPQDVRDVADAKMAKRLTPNLAEARAQAVNAASTRDADKAREIDTAQQATTKLNKETDSAQRRLVVENRGKVAALQGEGIGEAYENVNTFSTEAAKEQGRKGKAIREHVRTEESAARAELQKGEKEADDEKREGERKAAEKKKELEKAQKKKGWWDRVKGAIKSAVKAITSAIDKVFTAVRSAVKSIITRVKNAAIGLINRARNWVVERLNEFRDWATRQVDKYLKDAFPALAKRINGAINSVTDLAIQGVNKVADVAIAGVTALADGLTKVLDKILSTFQTALKTAVRMVGAVMQGDFAEALRAAIEGACEIAGVDPGPVFEFLDRAGKAIVRILRDPVGFIKKLFGAVGSGMGNFFKNIRKHLINGVVGWLTGALSEVDITGPFEFSARGVLSIVLQVLGVSYANIKARVIRKFPAAAAVFERVEQGHALMQRVLAEGPGALWEEIKEKVGNLKETVMGAIRTWLITTVIKEGIVWLLALTNPASAIVKAVKLVMDLVRFLVERYQQIKDFVLSVYEAVAEVVSGNFGKVTVAVEGALARVVPLLISLLATLLGLGGIAKQVQSVIAAVSKPVHRAIDWVVDRIVAFARKLVQVVKVGAKKAKAKAKDVARKVLAWWKAKVGFTDSTGESHSMYYTGEQGAATLMIASSNPTLLPAFLRGRHAKATAGGTSYTAPDVETAQTYHKVNVEPAEKQLRTADAGGSVAKKAKSDDDNRQLVDSLKKHLNVLATRWVRRFFDVGDPKDFPPPRLPVMADNARATDFDADYIVRAKRYKYSVRTGSESGKHVGNLGGWNELRGAKLTVGAKYVRMHCLPHKLGGDAVDSNLTPARGDLFNTPFSHAVEQPAIKASTENPEASRKPIWYRFRISYYPATTSPPAAWPTGQPYPASAFPRSIKASWGHYKEPSKGATGIERDKAMGERSAAPPLPDLAVTPPAINEDGASALFTALAGPDRPISLYFVREILIKHRPYDSKTKMRDVTWLKYGGEREATRRAYVNTVYEAVGKRVTLD